MLERFSSESCPMNQKNREMIAYINDLSDDIKARVAVCSDADEIRDVVAEYRPKLLDAIQEIIDYNAVDYVVMDPDSHIVTDPNLPNWFFAITNPRHMAWADEELRKEFTEKGMRCAPIKNEGRFDD